MTPRLVALVAITVLSTASGAWLGWSPADADPVEQLPPGAALVAEAKLPCLPRSGVAKPVSARIDPALDPELVGTAVPWPADVAPEWTEDELREVLTEILGPQGTLHCDEWPCLLELHAPDDTPSLTGDTLRVRDVVEDLAEHGLEVVGSGRVIPAKRGDRGEEVLIMPLRPKGRPTPAAHLREEVRIFWIVEGLRP